MTSTDIERPPFTDDMVGTPPPLEAADVAAVPTGKEVCPYCGGQGWYAVANCNTGEPEQEQCQWCAEREATLGETRLPAA